MTEDICLVEKRGHVLIVTLNRPAQRNALNAALRQRLRDVFDDYEADSELRCAILTANGTAFCAGGDLKEMASEAVQIPPEEWSLLLSSKGHVIKPVIGAVNGFALAGGFRLVQDLDLCIAADTAVFGISEVKRGRGAPWAAPLIDLMSKRVMMELLITGEPMTAQRAYEVGFVNRVVTGDRLLDEALAVAETVASNAPLSVAAGKKLVEISTELGSSHAVAFANAVYETVYRSDDAAEGPRAFAEKRQPVWTGR
ncbi:enoyl-CoA hydratase-related protein [Rhodococcus sp. NPDC127530]|uniref:enoyl-CoA hydratase-related protein n=1 Tax=unclassified Rhodococcus (in: high G+C Gram-positive bacteria) TaxID=192944 RepID=UPI00364318FA